MGKKRNSPPGTEKKPDSPFSRFLEQNRNYLLLLLVFYLGFLLLTPLGQFNDRVSDRDHLGFYSISDLNSADDIGYYIYLRSAFFDHNLDFSNEYDYSFRDYLTETGATVNLWPPGPAILWLPFFLTGHLLAKILFSLGYPVSPNGYTFPYFALVAVGAMVYAFLGLVISYLALKRFFSPRTALLSALLVFFASHLPFYTYIHQINSHSVEYFTLSLFLYLMILLDQNPRNKGFALLLGLAGGLVCLTRYNNAVFLLLPLGTLAFKLFKAVTKKNYRVMLLWLQNAGYFLLTFIPAVLPIFLVNHTLYGTWYPHPLLEYIEPGLGNFLKSLLNIFTGRDWGLIFAQPVWIFGLLGLIGFSRRQKNLGILFFLTLLTAFLIAARIKSEMELGYRYLLCGNVFIVFGVAWLIENYRQKFNKLILALSGFLILGQYLLIAQYKIFFEYNAPQLAFKALLQGIQLFFQPRYLLRSSSWLYFLLSGKFRLVDYLETFHLITFPLVMLVCLLLSLGLLSLIRSRRAGKVLLAVLALYFLFIDAVAFTLHHPLNRQESISHYRKAILHNFRKNQIETAETYFKKLFDLQPETSRDHHLLAARYLAQGKLPQARKELLIARSAAPDDPELLFETAILEFNQQNYLAAAQILERVVQIDPHHFQAYSTLVIIYQDKLKQPPQALYYLERMQEVLPKNKLIKEKIKQLRR